MPGIVDGMGFEEIGQVGSQVASLWMTGSLVVDDQISGANVYATTAVRTVTAVGTTLVSGATIVGTNVSGVTAVYATTLNATTASGTTSSFSVHSGATFVGTNLSGVTAVYGTTGYFTTISGTTTNMVTYSGNNAVLAGSVLATGNVQSASRVLSPAGTGSPTTWGRLVQAGSAATGAGSNLWVVYGTAYSAAAYAVASSAQTNEAILVPAGSMAAGSFYVETTTASKVFSWVAVGPA